MGRVGALRWVLVAVGVLLGILLLSRGFVLAGGLILVMAGLRAALVLSAGRRRREFAARRQERIAAWRAGKGDRDDRGPLR